MEKKDVILQFIRKGFYGLEKESLKPQFSSNQYVLRGKRQ